MDNAGTYQSEVLGAAGSDSPRDCFCSAIQQSELTVAGAIRVSFLVFYRANENT